MNDRITDLLDEVADDTGRPLGFTTADVVRGGLARRRHRAGVTAALALVAVGGLAGVLALTGPGDTDAGGGMASDPSAPTVPPSTAPTTATSGSAEPEELTGREALVFNRCSAQADPSLADWRLDAQVSDAEGSTATFVSPQGDRWRTCQLGSSVSAEAVSDPWPLETTAPTAEQLALDGGPEYALLCPKEAAASCTKRLYYATLPLREGVASVEVETPAGRTITPVLGDDTYVVRFVEDGTDDPLPVVTATLRDAAGEVIASYDYNDAMR